MEILSSIVSLVLKGRPFHSESLDSLAKTMHVTGILKNGKLQRYYRVHFLQACSLSYLNRALFEDKYLEMLLPDELLAVGAHEFTHIIKRHGIKRFWRIFMPAIAIPSVIGLVIFMNSELTYYVPFFNHLGLSSLLVATLLFPPAFVTSLYVNAKWCRQQETECDLSAVEFADGEAMISALNKVNKIRPPNVESLEYRLLPKTYPRLEQRISDILTAMRQKKSE